MQFANKGLADIPDTICEITYGPEQQYISIQTDMIWNISSDLRNKITNSKNKYIGHPNNIDIYEKEIKLNKNKFKLKYPIQKSVRELNSTTRVEL